MTTPFDELTDAELVALTPEQIDRYSMLAAAEAGVPIPPEEPAPFAEQKPSQDTIVFQIGGCKFTDRAVATQLQEYLMGLQESMVDTDYNWQVGSHAYYIKGYEGDLAISESTAYSASRYEELRTSITGYSERKSAADKARNEWSKDKRTYDDTIGWVSERVSEAREREWDRERNQARFDEYLSLADGDAKAAWRFFEKANLSMPDFRPVGAPQLVQEEAAAE